MQGFSPDVANYGLHRLATAISRSVALYVAMSITDEKVGLDGMLRNADTLAAWVNKESGVPQQRDWHPGME